MFVLRKKEKGAVAWDKVADVRKEQCASIGAGAILAEEPHIVVSGYIPPSLYLTQLKGLVHQAVSVAQICLLWYVRAGEGITVEDKSNKYGRRSTTKYV